MHKYRSFVPSDFALRDIPGFLFMYIGVSAVFVVVGMTLKSLPPFWSGMLCGLGFGFFVALYLLRQSKPTTIFDLPEPSEKVRAKFADPSCTFPSRAFAEAVKTYCDESGASLSEGTQVLKEFVAKRPS